MNQTKKAPKATQAQPKSNTRAVEISPYLWGRIGKVGQLDQMTRQQVITAALISFVDGEQALARYLNQIDPPEKYPKLQETADYSGVSHSALEKLAERIEPVVVAKLFGPPVDEPEPLTVTLQGEAAEAIRKVSKKLRTPVSHLAQIHCESSLTSHGLIGEGKGAAQ